ncbi:MAG: hypothetical protein SLRJCFUN_002575 [Candidatus Fervidibacter sp.]
MVTERDAWRVLLLSLGFFLGAQVAIASLGVILWAMEMDIREFLRLDWLLVLNVLLTTVALLTPIFVRGWQRRWMWRQALRWRPLPWRVALEVTFATLALNLAVSQGILWLLNMPFLQRVQEGSYGELLEAIAHHQGVPLVLVAAVMLQAVPEEVTFRGVVQQGLERRYAPSVAIGLTSLFFALFHLNPLQALSVLPTSLFWGWVAFRTQSIIPTVIAHALQNGLTALVLSLPSLSGQGDGSPLAQPPNWLAAVVGFLLWLTLTWHLTRRFSALKEGGEHGAREGVISTSHQTGVTDGSDGGGSLGVDERSGLAS